MCEVGLKKDMIDVSSVVFFFFLEEFVMVLLLNNEKVSMGYISYINRDSFHPYISVLCFAYLARAWAALLPSLLDFLYV